ncbi:MAG: hypothetical protein KDD58_14030 [Bdellovibrionales bacterium]|nr:hypothetical protein [Bdellovibrionales bacterium]
MGNLGILLLLLVTMGALGFLGSRYLWAVCVFSPVEGYLTKNSEPVSGAIILQNVDWQGVKTARTTTDETGYFKFYAIYSYSILNLFPFEFVAHQELIAKVKDQEYLLWRTAKRNPAENSELQGTPLNFSCDLQDNIRFDHSFDSTIETICRWKQ